MTERLLQPLDPPLGLVASSWAALPPVVGG